MEVWEKINYLLEEKKMSKQDFANRLIELESQLMDLNILVGK